MARRIWWAIFFCLGAWAERCLPLGKKTEHIFHIQPYFWAILGLSAPYFLAKEDNVPNL